MGLLVCGGGDEDDDEDSDQLPKIPAPGQCQECCINALKNHFTFSCLQQAAPQAAAIYDPFYTSLKMGYYKRETAAVGLVFTRNPVYFYGAEGAGIQSLE